MNLAHRWLCSSQIWRTLVRTQLAPWALDGVTLGDKVLEVGPGPGLTTECLRPLITDLTCIDINAAYASSLARRMAGQNVRVLAGDAARMPLATANFDAVVCFTTLHHVPSMALQDSLLREVLKVILVMGHGDCGAIKAVIKGGEVPGQISALYPHLQPAINREGPDPDPDATAKANAKIQAGLLRKASTAISGLIKEGKLLVRPAFYNIASGEVSLCCGHLMPIRCRIHQTRTTVADAISAALHKHSYRFQNARPSRRRERRGSLRHSE